jgi:predicted 2-oxoglutarate/Fe(II)-dependent dioxygenase YbiX
MLNLIDYIHCYEDILDKDLCKKIIDNSENIDFEKATTIGKTNLRNCYIDWLDKKFNTDLYEAVGRMLLMYKKDHKNFETGMTVEDTGYQHLIYIGTQENEYKEHVDHADLYPRVLTCSFILNDNYDGGDFVFFGGEYKVPPKTGSAVVFPSNFCFPHAVTPVKNGDRHAVITWIH